MPSATYTLNYLIGAKTTGSYYSNVNKASQTLTHMGSTVKRAVGVITGALAGISLKNLADDAVETYQTFETSMKNTAAISKATGSEYDRLESAARAAGRATTKTAAESADALGYMALAGWNTQQSIEGLMPILRLSEATGKDLKTTSDLVTDSLSAVGMQVDDLGTYMDKLVELNNDANTNAQQAMEALVKTGGAARALGVDFDDLSTSLGILANTGLKGSQAGTALNSIITRLASNDTAQKTLRLLKVDMYDSNKQFIGWEQLLEKINDRLSTMSKPKVMEALKGLGGTHYFSQLKYLLDGVAKSGDDTTSAFENLKAQIQDSDGALNAMNKTATSTLSASKLRLQSAFEDMQIGIVDVFSDPAREAIDTIAQRIPDLTDKIVEFGNEHAYDIVSMIETAADGAEKLAGYVIKAGDFIIDNRGIIEGVLAGIAGFKISRGVVSTISSIAGILPLLTRSGRASYIASAGGQAVAGAAGALGQAANVPTIAVGAGQLVNSLFGPQNVEGIAGSILKVSSAMGLVSAAAAGIFAIIRQYQVWNDKMVESNLDKHFGDIALDLEDIESVSKELIGSKEFQKLTAFDEQKQQIESEEKSIEKLKDSLAKGSWKIQMGIKLNKDEVDTYKNDVESIADQTQQWLSDKRYSINLALGNLGESKDSGLYNEINDYYTTQEDKAEKLSKKLKKLLKDALKDGVITVDEDKSIQNVQESLSKIKDATAQAELDAKLSRAGADANGKSTLSQKSYKSLSRQLAKDADEADKKYLDSYQEAATGVYAKYNAGNMTDDEKKASLDKLYSDYLTKSASAHAQTTNFMTEQLNNAYNPQKYFDKVIKDQVKQIEKNGASDIAREPDTYFKGLKVNSTSIDNGMDRQALKKLTPQLQEQVDQLNHIKKELQKKSAEIPKALSDSLTSSQAMLDYANGAELTWSQLAMYLTNSTEGQKLINVLREKGVQIPKALADAITSQQGTIQNAASQFYSNVRSAFSNEFIQGVNVHFPVNIQAYAKEHSNSVLFYSTGQSGSNKSSSGSGNSSTASGKSRSSSKGGKPKKHNALGGIYANPIYTSFAENGPEAALPLNNTSRAKELWAESGAKIGVGRRSALDRVLNSNTTNNNVTGDTFNNSMAPVFNITINGNASAKEVQNGIQMTYPELRKLAETFGRQSKRRSFSKK